MQVRLSLNARFHELRLFSSLQIIGLFRESCRVLIDLAAFGCNLQLQKQLQSEKAALWRAAVFLPILARTSAHAAIGQSRQSRLLVIASRVVKRMWPFERLVPPLPRP